MKKEVYRFYIYGIYIFGFVPLHSNRIISVIFSKTSQQLSVHFLQDTEKQKGKQSMTEKHENEMPQVKQKSKKLLNVKKEIPTDVKPR